MPKFKKPFLRPRLVFEYPPGLRLSVLKALYKAYSEWQEALYPEVISETPITKSEDPRAIRGFVRDHIKLMTSHGEKGLPYKTIGVPGGTVRGTPAFHALSAIYAFHGWTGRPLTIRPRRSKVLTFPLKKGEVFRRPELARPPPWGKGPKRWLVVPKVFQPSWGKPNPWIARIFEHNKDLLLRLVEDRIVKTIKRGRRVKVEVS